MAKKRDFGQVWRFRGKWTARWWEDGTLRQKAFPGAKDEATRFLAAKRIDLLERAARGDKALEPILFEALFEHYRDLFKGQKSPITVAREEAYLRSAALPHFTGKFVHEIRRADVERWLMRRVNEKKISTATRSRLLCCLRVFFKRAIALGHCEADPCAGIARGREQERPVPFLDVADQQKVIDALPLPIRPFFTILLDTGLRLSEGLNLTPRDIDFHRGLVTVRASKNYTPRDVPFTVRGKTALEAAIAHHERSGGSASGRIFEAFREVGKCGETKLFSHIRRQWKDAVAKAGFPELRIHDCRHVFAVTAARAGVPLAELRLLLGHKSMIMVLRYSRHCPGNTPELARARIEAHLEAERRKRDASRGDAEPPAAAAR